MHFEIGKNQEKGSSTSPSSSQNKVLSAILVLLRLGGLVTTGAAVVVMGLNKQKKVLTFGLIGTSYDQTRVVYFQSTPAFVYNLSVLLLAAFVKCRSLKLLLHLSDMVIRATEATAAAAAATIADVGKNGSFYTTGGFLCATSSNRSATAVKSQWFRL